ncbi:hypothetical protein DFH07DRAFT_962243 [Mycena maculata]|uniref:Uncharacterized protein n=1 Tax=Mycena maculata TaxID=230809 RepID=A0AAD7N7V0_9AGAR|nr:hypothetical protein DFH07DRAFT_962243 [Mycena maculata]
MPFPSKRQFLAQKTLNQPHPKAASSSASETENTHPNDVSTLTKPSIAKPKKPALSLKAQLLDKDVIIANLEGTISQLSADLTQLQDDNDRLSRDNQALQEQKRTLTVKNQCMNSLKRKAEDDTAKKRKRIKRLERERDVKEEKNMVVLSSLEDNLYDKSAHISHLERDLASAIARIHSQDHNIASLRASLRERQDILTAIRKQLYAALKKIQRHKDSLKTIRDAYNALRVWNAMTNGQYTAVARELARALTYAGCAAEKIEYAVQACAKAFGIKIRRRFMSARTVARAIDEGGKYGDLQLAREIMDAPGFVESSDGTTLHGVTIESRHVTLLAPSYAPGTDDNDQSTWTHQTCFVEVAPALDHTAERQFEGTKAAAARVADTYSRSPLAAQERRVMDKNDYFRKKLGENKDHAADGKKEFRISEAHKKDIIIGDLGRAAMAEADVDTAHILLTVLSITDDDLRTAGKVSEAELAALSSQARSDLVEQVLECKLGEEKFEAMTEDEQSNLCTHFFGGCCCHKDLNVVEYGYKSVQRTWSTYGLEPPVLLANKANAATISAIEDPDSTALKNAVESSSSGGIKLLQLIGALLRHKDRQRGYQDRTTMFLREMKLELYDLDKPTKFPDVSNTRYGCYTYAAAEVVTFHGLIQTLIQEICDGKTKSGQENHIEQNVLKGLNCAATMTELVALALYGASVSWPYMATVRSTKANPINLLDLTDIHRKLPKFCTHIAANPQTLLNPNTPLNELTIDGAPFRDPLLLESIRQLLPDLKSPFLLISRMFTGAETGWIIFTPEFHIGGTINRLTPEQRRILFVLSTNDCSEGMLGTHTVHMRYHPNSTTHSFSNQTRTERNNTEAFIKKCCDPAVEKFVMREVRKDGTRQLRAQFRREWLARQREKAEKALKRRAKTAAWKTAAAFRLATTILEFDLDKIHSMNSKTLKDQLQFYKDVLKDEILVAKKWKDMVKVEVRRNLVLEAWERELARRELGDSQMDTTVGTRLGTANDDGEWEDTDSED